MLFALAAVAIAVAVLLLVVLMRRGSARDRGDLLGPPTGLGTAGRLASPQPAPPSAHTGRREGASPLDDLPDAVAAEARRLLAQDRKLDAIKLIRATIRCELGEAKAWVERQ